MSAGMRRSLLTAGKAKPAFIAGCYGGYVLTSPDGLSFERHDPSILTQGTTSPYDDVMPFAASPTMVVAGYYRASGSPLRRGIMTSADAVNWVDSSALPQQYSFTYQIGNQGTNWLVLNSNGGYSWSTNDASTWTALTFPSSITSKGVVYAGGTLNKWFCATMDGSCTSTTTPGTQTSWSAASNIGAGTSTFLYWSPSLNMLVAVPDGGLQGAVYTSTNGTSWTYRSLGVEYSTGAGAWSPSAGIFVLGLYNNKVATSTDGVSWTIRTIASLSGDDVIGVAWSPSAGLFVATGGSASRTNYVTSPDGITWTSRNWPASAAYATRMGALTAAR